MAYDHKKSNRTITDEQFSDGTTVDGARIDQALQDSVEHFNEVPLGDASTRMMQQQFVFGCQPAMYTSMPSTYSVPYGDDASMFRTNFSTSKGTADGTTLPWLPIKNNKYTAVTTNQTTDWTAPGGITSADLESSTPSGGFQNEWRYKGTRIIEWGEGPQRVISNEGKTENEAWADFWLRGETEPASLRSLSNGYQLAWSHSWSFAAPCILHDLMVYLRTDRKTVDYFGYYSKPLGYTVTPGVTGAGGPSLPCKQLYVSICVDNPFAAEDRSMNDNEVVVWNRRIDAASTSPASRNATGASPTMTYTDMDPNSPEDIGGTGGDSLWGFLYRLSDMNIPIHRDARVRMAIAVPWYPRATYVDAVGTTQPAEGNLEMGWADGAHASRLWSNASQKAFWQYGEPPGSGEPMGPSGIEPMGGMSINGCLTILEEVVK
tara:strand:- start:1263 stop:2561 length:1299 start_codon:yes stop_codon:yes gene_type:complete